MPLSCKVIKKVENKLENYSVDTRKIYRENNCPQESFLNKAKQEADNVISNAEKKAEKIIEEVKKRVPEIEKKAYDVGFEKGHEKGYKKGQEEASKEVQKEAKKIYKSAKEVFRQAEEIRENTYKELEKEIMELAVEISEKIVFRQLDLVPETIVDIARNACQKKRESKMFIIYANPQYIDILRTKRNDIISELDSDVGIQIVSDSNIKSGGCRVENEDGFVDATLESMLKKIGLEVKGEA